MRKPRWLREETSRVLWAAHGQFTVIDGPSSTDDGPAIRTLAKGINAAGDVTGYYDTAQKRHGFLLRRDGVFTTIDLEGTQGPPPNGDTVFCRQRNRARGVYVVAADGAVGVRAA